jgi:pyrimidine-nucleoside phosphorylase
MELGAGRATKEDSVDLAVGIVLNKKRGNKVSVGETLAYVHANDEGKIDKAKKAIIESYHITSENREAVPLIYGVVR